MMKPMFGGRSWPWIGPTTTPRRAGTSEMRTEHRRMSAAPCRTWSLLRAHLHTNEAWPVEPGIGSDVPEIIGIGDVADDQLIAGRKHGMSFRRIAEDAPVPA